MTALAWFFSILAGCLDGRLRIVAKRSLMPLLPFIVATEAAALPGLAIAVFFWGPTKIKPMFWVAAIAIAPLLALGSAMLVQAIRISELTVTTVYLNLTPVFMLITATVFGLAMPSPLGVAGIILTTIGIYVVNVVGKTDHLWTPLSRAWGDKGARLMIGVAFVFSLTANILAVGIENSNGPVFMLAMHAGMAVCLGSLLLFPRFRNGVKLQNLIHHKREVLEAAACVAIGDVCLYLSFISMPVMALSIIGKRVGTTFFTLGFSGEKTALGFRTVGAAIAVLGMVIIILWGKAP